MQRLQFWRFDNEGVHAVISASAHLGRSGLERSLLELVYLRVSQLNDCSYCVDAHGRDALASGVNPDLVRNLASWRENPSLTERERAALGWAEAVTEISETGAPDDVYRETAARFSEKELVDLTLGIGLMNAFARIAMAFRHGPPPMPALIDGPVATTGA